MESVTEILLFDIELEILVLNGNYYRMKIK